MNAGYIPGLATMRKIATITSSRARPPNALARCASRSYSALGAPPAFASRSASSREALVGRREHRAGEPEQHDEDRERRADPRVAEAPAVQREVQAGEQHDRHRRRDEPSREHDVQAVQRGEVAAGALDVGVDDRVGEHDAEGDDHGEDVDRQDEVVERHGDRRHGAKRCHARRRIDAGPPIADHAARAGQAAAPARPMLSRAQPPAHGRAAGGWRHAARAPRRARWPSSAARC